MAALSLLATGCSKEEMEESVTEGVSAVATPVINGSARFGDDSRIGEMWFDTYENRLSLRVRLTGNTLRPVRLIGTASLVGDETETATDFSLDRIGNSVNYRADSNTQQWNWTHDNVLFSLVNIHLQDWNGQGDFSSQLFLYPSGRTVVQDPKVMRVGGKENGRLEVIIADDPAQEVASVELRVGDDVIQYEKTHVNQALGLSKWDGWDDADTEPWEWTGSNVTLIIKGAPYTQTFGSHEHAYSRGGGVCHLGRCFCTEDLSGTDCSGPAGRWVYEESDEPLIVGSKLTSTNRGETYTLTVAIADVGDWVENVRYTFLESEGPAPVMDTYQLTLVGEGGGNLKVFEVQGVRFNAHAFGSSYQGLVFNLGTGTRTSSSQANSKAELL